MGKILTKEWKAKKTLEKNSREREREMIWGGQAGDQKRKLSGTGQDGEIYTWAELLEAWLALTSVKYHDNLLILMLLNQWLALTMLRTTGSWPYKP